MKTASSQSSKYPVVHRHNLYYGKYRYRVTFTVEGASRTRYVRSVAEFNKRIMDSLTNSSSPKQDLLRFQRIDRDKIQRLIDLRDLTSGYALMSLYYNSDNVNLYVNDESVINKVRKLKFDDIKVTEAVASIPLEVMLFAKTPPAQFRVYFKDRRIDAEFKTKMRQFLSNYPDIRPSDSLKLWLADSRVLHWYNGWLRSSHFVDFDHDSLYTLLIMGLPDNSIRKHFRLEQKK